MRSPHSVTAFNIDLHQNSNEATYKTVNIYSLSLPSWQRIIERLDCYISTGKVNAYYESVFAEMLADGNLEFECVFCDKTHWYEIDTPYDLRECERIFEQTENRYRIIGPVNFAE